MMYFADDNNNLTVQRMTNGTLPDVPFVVLKNKALGKKYELSVLFPHGELSRELHRTWKQKNDPVNILSFPLDEYSGEIIITLETARREAKKIWAYLPRTSHRALHSRTCSPQRI
ncbi:MAG: rRNA maturation RNAse YbeY [Candidatus Pacebacteria bacterium]|nr:rRNA maturation RNAse YbeY [Candidatus Paceibacterota bacterium]